ncbi:MAG TPA: hypothetical protein VFW44_12015, partial [Bryobacteraceae bacterium]|nr:hypothetical protein [Bryobacteraceae bacterium]
GRLVCSGDSRGGQQLPCAACWDTRTGAKTSENSNVGLDWQGIASAGGDLLAITDYKNISHHGKLWVFLDMDGDHSVARRHLLWNLRTGEEIASWGGPFYQTDLVGRDLKSASKRTEPFVLSLSPTGKYVAEGGAGSITVYAVQP